MKKAIVFMVISALSFSVLNILVKDLRHFNVYQIVFFRSGITLCFTIPLLIKNNIKPLGNQRKLLFARGTIGFVAMTLFFASLQYLKQEQRFLYVISLQFLLQFLRFFY